MTFARYTLDGTVCVVIPSCTWPNDSGLSATAIGLWLSLGTVQLLLLQIQKKAWLRPVKIKPGTEDSIHDAVRKYHTYILNKGNGKALHQQGEPPLNKSVFCIFRA